MLKSQMVRLMNYYISLTNNNLMPGRYELQVGPQCADAISRVTVDKTGHTASSTTTSSSSSSASASAPTARRASSHSYDLSGRRMSGPPRNTLYVKNGQVRLTR